MAKADFWRRRGERNGWVMPSAPRWKRLPVIRHIRAVWATYCVYRWYRYGPGGIGIPTGFDEWVIEGIWIGEERGNNPSIR